MTRLLSSLSPDFSSPFVMFFVGYFLALVTVALSVSIAGSLVFIGF